MGTDLELIGIDLGSAELAEAAGEIDRLEQHWSRFRPSSDLSRLNRSPGVPVALPAVTFDLIVAALDACGRTAGWFDPTILPALEAAGYDRTFADLIDPADEPRPVAAARPAPAPAPGPGRVALDVARRTVTLEGRVALDLGGVGKGRAADLIAERWLAAGTSGCVNLGGDLRAVGEGPDGAWSVAVDDPFDPARTVAVIGLVAGAVATSATTKRAWQRGGVRQHHLIDPRTGQPSVHTGTQVTVIASCAFEADVWAKAALLAGPDGPALLASAGLPGLFVDRSDVRPVNGMEDYLW
ncbi:MAG: thiamine biosynthesis lipoprotein ApbE [Acidimicrobiales bacterium]|nr:thiamine biosynthesis lipoprotein ApbE [Acidimicrobiales bacterium]